MCPMYEYHCQGCGNQEDKLLPFEKRDSPSCAKCGAKLTRLVSLANHKWASPFFKDGEGFSSVTYSPGEYKERIKNNLLKEDKV